MSSIVKQKYPIKLRGTAMEEFQIFEVTFFNLSPCAAQRYRGSAHRARGLVLQKILCASFLTPLFVAAAPLSLPYIAAQHRGEGGNTHKEPKR